MKRFWCCRDLEGAANEEVFLFVGEEPPIMDDDGEWVDPRKKVCFGRKKTSILTSINFWELLSSLS